MGVYHVLVLTQQTTDESCDTAVVAMQGPHRRPCTPASLSPFQVALEP